MPATPSRVWRRRVFYIHGFDPRGPAPYHRMFVEEAARQAPVDGAEITVGKRRAVSPIAAEWAVEADYGGGRASTRYTFLRWDDVARGLWSRGDGRVFRELAGWAADYLRSDGFGYAWRGAKPGFWAMMIAPLVVCALTLAALVMAALVAVLGNATAPRWGLLAGLIPLALAYPAWKALDRAFNVSWLSRCFAFIGLASRLRSAALIERTEAFAGQIIAACEAGEADEVLVIGHSQGAPVSIQSLARALRRRPDLARLGPELSLLTLGQPISLWNYLTPKREGFLADVETVRDADGLFWLDVTSPSDGASACGIDPVDVAGRLAEDRPARRSPRFHAVLDPATFRRIRRRPFDYHFQYLRASDEPGAYSFFRLACGPDPLRRFRETWTAKVLEAA